MCCFSGRVESVTNTRIYARGLAAEGPWFRQGVVYQMNYRTKQDVAMILPLPVASEAGEAAVNFLNFAKLTDFFSRLEATFPVPPTPRSARGTGGTSDPFGGKPPLQVHAVGSYEASYVPSVADFSRLDARFRLPAGTWDQLPQYAAYGFAVFKLKPAATSVHPMAFTFPQGPGARGVFFPTVHIHDGKVHAQAGFSHTLYTQKSQLRPASLMHWEESEQPAQAQLRDNCHGLVHPQGHFYRQRLFGKLPNQDTWV